MALLDIRRRYAPGEPYFLNPPWLPVENVTFSSSAPITIDATQCGTADSSDFPFLFSGMFGNLRTIANGGLVQSASGYDICFFSDVKLTTLLVWEVESYDQITGTIVAWIRIPTVSHSVNTVLYCAYGSTQLTTFQGGTGSVWPNTYAGVWHLGDGTTLSATNAVNNTTGTVSGPTATTGQVDGGALVGTASTDEILTTLTSYSAVHSYSVWAYRTGNGGGGIGAIFAKFTTLQSENLQRQVTGDLYQFSCATNGTVAIWTIPAPSASAWHHIVITYDNSLSTNVPVIYADSISQSVTTVQAYTGTPNVSTDVFSIGNVDNNHIRNWAGSIDEFRVANTTLTQSWITTEYNNQFTPNTFATTTIPTNVTLGSIALTVAQQAPAMSGAGASTLGSTALTTTLPAPTETGLAASTLNSIALTLAQQAPTVAGLAAVTLAVQALTKTLQTPTVTSVASSTLGVVTFSLALGVPTEIAAAAVVLSPLSFTVARSAVSSGTNSTLNVVTLAISLHPVTVFGTPIPVLSSITVSGDIVITENIHGRLALAEAIAGEMDLTEAVHGGIVLTSL